MREAAALRGIKYETFRYHVGQGRGPRIHAMNGRHPLYLPKDVDAWKHVDHRRRKPRNETA